MQVQSWHDSASDGKAVRPVKTGTRVKFVHVISSNICAHRAQEGIRRSRKQQNLDLTQSQISPDTFHLISFGCKYLSKYT